jgi:hypothetical protein
MDEWGKQVVSKGDLKPHDCTRTREKCWCKPEWSDNDEVLVHNSMDGREKHENGAPLN